MKFSYLVTGPHCKHLEIEAIIHPSSAQEKELARRLEKAVRETWVEFMKEIDKKEGRLIDVESEIVKIPQNQIDLPAATSTNTTIDTN